MSEKGYKFSTDFAEATILFICVLCWGTPDIIDGIVYKLTGLKVWECPENTCYETVKK
jgi:hypothetical protein